MRSRSCGRRSSRSPHEGIIVKGVQADEEKFNGTRQEKVYGRIRLRRYCPYPLFANGSAISFNSSCEMKPML